MSSMGMPAWSRVLLNAYYYASLPQRRREILRCTSQGRAPVMILFYHRVADTEPNAWTMSTRTFRRQMLWLKRNFKLVSLSEAQQRVLANENQEPVICVTFDDGYADNCSFALPLLIQERIPATYFVTSRNVIDGTPFPHDAAAGRPLKPNTLVQLRSMVAAGIDIGAHTRSHPNLACVTSQTALRDEVVGSRNDLREALQCDVDYFAFPFGLHENLNASAFHLAREAGIRGVCSAYGGYNFPGDDPFHLQRIHGDAEMIRFKNWLTVDRRKLSGVERYQYDHRDATNAGGALS